MNGNLKYEDGISQVKYSNVPAGFALKHTNSHNSEELNNICTHNPHIKTTGGIQNG